MKLGVLSALVLVCATSASASRFATTDPAIPDTTFIAPAFKNLEKYPEVKGISESKNPSQELREKILSIIKGFRVEELIRTANDSDLEAVAEFLVDYMEANGPRVSFRAAVCRLVDYLNEQKGSTGNPSASSGSSIFLNSGSASSNVSSLVLTPHPDPARTLSDPETSGETLSDASPLLVIDAFPLSLGIGCETFDSNRLY